VIDLAGRAERELGMQAAPEDARRDVQVLLGFALGKSRAWLVAHSGDTVEEESAQRFRTLLGRRVRGEPVAYLVGEREFYGLAFRVTPEVLIPRPETELLVDAALERLPADADRNVVDLGTGSGCIAIAIAHARSRARVLAADRSVAALDVAQANAARIGVAVEFALSDWFEGLAGRRFDQIVSNPPYVAEGDPHLARGDLRFEPLAALASGSDGLRDLRRIIAGAPRHLYPGGWLILEHGHDQGAACSNLLRDAGFTAIFTMADLAGLPRISGGRLLTENSPSR
jgi:release factor glutamine methyltransferase